MKRESEFFNIINGCFKKSNIHPPKSLETLKMNLDDVDICLDCDTNILCKDGLEKNDEPNAYGLVLEETIDFLLQKQGCLNTATNFI
jgi:hypothetical protein